MVFDPFTQQETNSSSWAQAPAVGQEPAWKLAPTVTGNDNPAWTQAPAIETNTDAFGEQFGIPLETAAPVGPVTSLEPLPEVQPEMRDESKGFVNNISLRKLKEAPRHGMAGNLLRWITGNTDAEQERRRRALGQDVDPIEREFNAALESAYQAGGYDSADYRKLDEAFQTYQKARDNPEFKWGDLKAAIADDFGGTAAEFVKAVAADPELLLTPLGWSKAAASAGAVAKTAGASRNIVTTAKIAGGATGAAATGAAVQAPISVAQQLGEDKQDINWKRVGRESAVAGTVSAPIAGLFVGAGAAMKAARRMRGRPEMETGALDREAEQTASSAEREAPITPKNEMPQASEPSTTGAGLAEQPSATAAKSHAPDVRESVQQLTVAVNELTELNKAVAELRKTRTGAGRAASEEPDVPGGKLADIDAETPRGERSVGAKEAEAIQPESKLGEIIDTVARSARKVGKEAIDVTGGKAITYLDDLAKASPTAKKLRNLIEYEEFSKEPIGPSFYERTSLKTGEFGSRLNDTLDELRGALGKMPSDTHAKLTAALRGERVGAPVAEPALKIRALLNEVRDYTREQGLDVGFIENYFPRIYKRHVLDTDAGRQGFIRVLQRHGIEAPEADLIASRITNDDGILVTERMPKEARVDPRRPHETFEPGRVRQKHGARFEKNLETARKLSDIPDSELAPFLEDNAPAVLTRYVENTVRRAEYARIFGPGEGKLNKMVRDIITEAAQAGRPARPGEIQRIYDLADAMQRTYRPILTPMWRKANQWVMTYEYLRTLPLATISSLSEPFLVIARGRPGTVPAALASAIKHSIHETIRVVYRRFPKAEATQALEDIGLGLDAALAERLTASFGGEVTKFNAAFFKANFLHQFTRFNRVLANETGKLMVTRHLRDLTKGVSAPRAAQIHRELAELGVDAEAGMVWVRRGAAQSDAFYETVKAAGLRFTNETVMNPRPTNRPMWMSNPHYALLAQLKGFQTVFGNTVLKRWGHMLTQRGVYEGARNGGKMAVAGVLMVLTAMLGNALREFIKYGEGGNQKFKDEDQTKTVYRAMERAGFLGAFQFASDAMLAHRFGSPAIAQLAGPTVSQTNELIEGAGKAMEGNMRPMAREVANAVPIANVIPSVRKEITDSIAGEPERSRRRRERN